MKQPKDKAYLVKIAKRYYIDGFSQQQLAAEFRLSRPTISNLLKRCKDEGIVDIRIAEPDNSAGALADRLTANFPVRQALIAESRHDYQSTLESVGEKGAYYLQSVLTKNSRLGIAWGSALFQVVRHMPYMNLSGVEVIQMVGGTSAENANYDGFEIARSMAVRLQGSYHILPAPIIVQSESLHNMLIHEPGIAKIIRKTPLLTNAIVGISSDVPENSPLVSAGFLSKQESAELIEQGIIGHVCGYHFTAEGIFPDIPVNRRIVGISLQILQQIPIIAVACGSQKTGALTAALKTGIIDTIITDEHTAVKILLD
ncbi:MAG: sugar-binding transcriptional regulator [Spirochaetia bacterium]|nr:sugar-binding transcriptional regulator [Spirochaetia bacterium]